MCAVSAHWMTKVHVVVVSCLFASALRYTHHSSEAIVWVNWCERIETFYWAFSFSIITCYCNLLPLLLPLYWSHAERTHAHPLNSSNERAVAIIITIIAFLVSTSSSVRSGDEWRENFFFFSKQFFGEYGVWSVCSTLMCVRKRRWIEIFSDVAIGMDIEQCERFNAIFMRFKCRSEMSIFLSLLAATHVHTHRQIDYSSRSAYCFVSASQFISFALNFITSRIFPLHSMNEEKQLYHHHLYNSFICETK